jgi:hypothetical protein
MAVTFLADHGGTFTACPCELKRELRGTELTMKELAASVEQFGKKSPYPQTSIA